MSDVKSSLTLDGDRLIVKHTQNLELSDTVNHYREQAALNGSREMKPKYFIPDILIIEWMGKGIDFFSKEGRQKITKMLETPEYAHLKL